ncbi:transposase [Streptomyces sp. OE57]|uniref:transposase n=1 Tax=Streptomyces lacaronensis TaxID=3379885 RepID=UPI0039B72539
MFTDFTWCEWRRSRGRPARTSSTNWRSSTPCSAVGELPAQGRCHQARQLSQGPSSRRLRQAFPDLVRHCWRVNKPWPGSYFAGTGGGAPLSVVRQYIEQQNRPV